MNESEPMRVLVTEPLAAAGLMRLREQVEADEKFELGAEELLEVINSYDALIIRSATQVDQKLLEHASKLKVVGRAGIGLDNVDVDACTRRGIVVVNAPQSNVLSAAEHTFALMLAQARNVPQAHASLIKGSWARERYQGVELHAKTLGIVGLGRVGTLVAQRATAFGMRLVAYDPYISQTRAAQVGVEMLTSVQEVVERADFLTIHLPRTKETIGIISAKELAWAKPGLRIINTARGGLIDENALADAIEQGQISGAAIDVFEDEPVTDHRLFDLPEVVVTPHLGASTQEAQDKAGTAIAEQVLLALRGEFAPYAVNLEVGPDIPEAVRAFLGLAARLGRVAVALAGSGVDCLRFEYYGRIAEHDTRALTLAGLRGAFSAVVHEPVTFVNAPLIARDRGVSVEEWRSSESHDYVNLVEVHALCRDEEVSVAGVLVGKRNDERLVRAYGYELDTAFSPIMVMFRYEDRPGIVGIVGGLMGRAQVNIASMQVARLSEGGEALMTMSVDSPIPDGVLDEIVAQAKMRDARLIVLGPADLK